MQPLVNLVEPLVGEQAGDQLVVTLLSPAKLVGQRRELPPRLRGVAAAQVVGVDVGAEHLA